MGPLGPLGPRSLLPSRNHGLEHPPFSSMIGPFECLFCSSRISEKAMFDFRDIIQYTEWWSLGQLCFKIHHREKSSSHWQSLTSYPKYIPFGLTFQWANHRTEWRIFQQTMVVCQKVFLRLSFNRYQSIIYGSLTCSVWTWTSMLSHYIPVYSILYLMGYSGRISTSIRI